jgi:hypothetical protein
MMGLNETLVTAKITLSVCSSTLLWTKVFYHQKHLRNFPKAFLMTFPVQVLKMSCQDEFALTVEYILQQLSQ